jgi:hypothetical protein
LPGEALCDGFCAGLTADKRRNIACIEIFLLILKLSSPDATTKVIFHALQCLNQIHIIIACTHNNKPHFSFLLLRLWYESVNVNRNCKNADGIFWYLPAPAFLPHHNRTVILLG